MAEETPTPAKPQHQPKAPRVQVPTIGRAVHYTTSSGKTRPAVITDLDDGITSLTVMNPLGCHYVEDVEFSEEPQPNHWSWPPRV